METSAMKSAGLFFILCFVFFFFGQLLWSVEVVFGAPLFGGGLDQTLSSHAFTLCSLLGLVASVKFYKAA